MEASSRRRVRRFICCWCSEGGWDLVGEGGACALEGDEGRSSSTDADTDVCVSSLNLLFSYSNAAMRLDMISILSSTPTALVLALDTDLPNPGVEERGPPKPGVEDRGPALNPGVDDLGAYALVDVDVDIAEVDATLEGLE